MPVDTCWNPLNLLIPISSNLFYEFKAIQQVSTRILSWDLTLFHLFYLKDNIIIPYENGARKNSSSDVVNLPNGPLVTMRLNGNDGTGSVGGCDEVEIDEVSLWDRVLNMSEFIALRVQPFDTNCTGECLILYHKTTLRLSLFNGQNNLRSSKVPSYTC